MKSLILISSLIVLILGACTENTKLSEDSALYQDSLIDEIGLNFNTLDTIGFDLINSYYKDSQFDFPKLDSNAISKWTDKYMPEGLIGSHLYSGFLVSTRPVANNISACVVLTSADDWLRLHLITCTMDSTMIDFIEIGDNDGGEIPTSEYLHKHVENNANLIWLSDTTFKAQRILKYVINDDKKGITDSVRYEIVDSVFTILEVGKITSEYDITKEGPIKYFISLADTIDEHGWSSDTARLNKVPIYSHLEYSNMQLFNNRPFYKIDLKYCGIFNYERDYNYSGDSRAKRIDFDLFRKAKSIWGYFYRIDNEDNYIVDGVIEQWEFEDESLVKSAIENLKQVYPLPYFNTSPYYHQVDNYLFIFHTRASNFCNSQRDFYKIFKKITSSN